jgi:FkbM family methyltransferase
MSKHFRENGWRAICFEPNPKFVEMHRNCGHEIYQVACSDEEKDDADFFIVEHGWPEDKSGISFSSLGIRYPECWDIAKQIKVKVRTLNTLLGDLNVDKIDLLSVDVEGWEIEVVKGLDVEKYQPKVVVLEIIQDVEKYLEYMESIGYNLHHNIQINYIFTKKSWIQSGI